MQHDFGPKENILSIEEIHYWLRENKFNIIDDIETNDFHVEIELMESYLRVQNFIKYEKEIPIAKTAIAELTQIDFKDEFAILKWCWKYREFGAKMIDFGFEYILGSEKIDDQIITVLGQFYCDAKPFKEMICVFFIYLNLPVETSFSNETILSIKNSMQEYYGFDSLHQ